MTRRKQKLSRARARTMWLAWCAWGVIGSIFLFEDTAGGTGWLSLILTAPFWVMFALWPLLWAYLRFRNDPALVEMDDDFPAPHGAVRVVQKDGVRFAEIGSLVRAFGLDAAQVGSAQTIEGGDELFAPLDALRALSGDKSDLQKWLSELDDIPFVH